MKVKTSTDELVEILFAAIKAQPYFNEDVLKPIIKANIVAFRLCIAAKNYNKIANPSETAKMIRCNELKNLECEFWKKALKDIVGDDIKAYYLQLDRERDLWNNG